MYLLVIMGAGFLVAGLVVLGLIAAGSVPGALALMAIIFVFVGLLEGTIGLVILRNTVGNRRLLANGVAGRGTFLEVKQTNTRVNNQPVVRVTLEIEVPGQATYQIKKRLLASYGTMGMWPGAHVGVKVDPANPRHVAIDWNGPTLRQQWSSGEAMAAAQVFMGPQFAPPPPRPQVDPDQLDLPVLPPLMASMTADEQRENVRELGAPGRAVVDAVSVVGTVGEKMGYRLGMWVQLDSGPSFRVDNGPATVDPQYASKVVPGVTVPLHIAHVRPGVTMTVLEWDRV
jgi:hypothetical protein